MRRTVVTFILAAVLGMPGSLLSQRTNANLSGTVTDPSGAAVPGATVTAIAVGTQTPSSSDTSASGFYIIPNLGAGTYNLRVEKAGFRTYVQDGIVLDVDRATTVNAQLTLGAATQTVTVTAQGSQVNVRSATQVSEITSQFAVELPLNGRDILQEMSLAPDVGPGASTYWQQSATRPEMSGFYVSPSGGQGNTTGYFLDGGMNMDPYTNVANVFPNPDAVQEFSFETNNYSAKFTAGGGGIMNAITKGGTNNFHGDLWEFVRNGPLFDARNWFANGPTATTDLLKWNQFGGTIGGPIQKDKTFFFFSYQALRERVGAAISYTTTPNALELDGNFSQFTTQLVNPYTGAAFPGNIVPTTLFDKLTAKIDPLYPVANLPTASVNPNLAAYVKPSAQNDNQFVGRLDHNFGTKLRLYGSYLYDGLYEPAISIPGDALTVAPDEYWRSQHFTLNAAYTFRPNLIANFTATEERDPIYYHIPTNVGFPDFTELGAAIVNMVPPGFIEPFTGSVSGYFSFPGGDGIYRVPRNEYDYGTNWTWIKGNHTIEFGGELTRDHTILDQDFLSDGDITFAGAYSGNNLLDYFMGFESSYEQISPLYLGQARTLPAAYINDTWKVSRHLTATLGVRWNAWVPFNVDYHEITFFSPTAFAAGTHSSIFPNLPPGELVDGDPGVPATGIKTDHHLFDPRVGIAYDVFGNGSTAIRAGYGVYHDQLSDIQLNRQTTSPPDAVMELLSPPAINPALNETPFDYPFQATVDPYPVSRPAPFNYTFPEPFLLVPFMGSDTHPTTQQWNLSVERQFPAQTLVKIIYEGSNSWHMLGGIEGNAAVYNPNLTFTQNEAIENARRPMGQYFAQLEESTTMATSNFNSLVISVEKRMSHGISFLGGYRYSRCLDEVSASDYAEDDYSIPAGTNPRHDYGPCTYNYPDQFQGSYIFQLPRLQGHSLLTRETLGGWEANAIVVVRSGSPFSVTSGLDRSTSGIGNDRADLVAGQNWRLPGNRTRSQEVAEYFNTGAYQLNALGTFGDAARDSLTGPGTENVDFSIVKSFPVPKLGEQSRFDFRSEFFNGFNLVNFSNPGASINSPSTYGKITSAANPRIIQFALKYYF